MDRKKNSKLYIAAIDFGTSGCGYAVRGTSSDSKIIVPDSFPGSSAGMIGKTPTQIILNKDRKCVAFGFQVQKYYIENLNHNPDEYPLFSYYKMKLFDTKTRSKPIKSVNSEQTATVQELITETLKQLVDLVMNKIKSITPFEVFYKDIKWVLTIPAIWDDSAKLIMRECSINVGICSKNNPESLLLCLEPEAGALDCIFEKTNSYKVRDDETYLVIDNGGGTGDFKAYRQRKGFIDSISKSFGGEFGSSYVNENFLQFLKGVFGTAIIEQRRNKLPFLKFLQEFENDKIGFTKETPLKSISLNPYSVLDRDETWIKKVIEAYNFYKEESRHITYNSEVESLVLPYQVYYGFFEPLFERITRCILNEIEKNDQLKKLDYIFFIGGFNQSQILRNYIQEKLKFTGATFVCSKNPIRSVVIGAIYYGLDPSVLAKRIMNRSYGAHVLIKKEPGEHLNQPTTTINGITYVDNYYDKFISAGDEVETDKVIQRTYIPVSKDQLMVEISIFCSSSANIKYITEPNVQYLGTFKVELPNVDVEADQKKIIVSMKFGLEELKVSYINVLKQEEIKPVDFDFVMDEEEAIRRNDLYRKNINLYV